jgi:hypothetical protein
MLFKNVQFDFRKSTLALHFPKDFWESNQEFLELNPVASFEFCQPVWAPNIYYRTFSGHITSSPTLILCPNFLQAGT